MDILPAMQQNIAAHLHLLSDEQLETAYQAWLLEATRPSTITEHRMRLRYVLEGEALRSDIKRMVARGQQLRCAALS